MTLSYCQLFALSDCSGAKLRCPLSQSFEGCTQNRIKYFTDHSCRLVRRAGHTSPPTPSSAFVSPQRGSIWPNVCWKYHHHTMHTAIFRCVQWINWLSGAGDVLHGNIYNLFGILEISSLPYNKKFITVFTTALCLSLFLSGVSWLQDSTVLL